MKKEYLSPEAEVIRFAPVEELANGWTENMSGDDWIDKGLEGDDGDGDGEG